MRQKNIFLIIVGLLFLFPIWGMAQMEKISIQKTEESIKRCEELTSTIVNPYLKTFWAGRKEWSERQMVNAVRVAEDIGKHPEFNGSIVYYSVPAMSEQQRLPDTYPLDGKAFSTVRIITAKDEYEPGSFVLYSLADLGKVELKLSAFKSKEGKEIAPENLDLKVIKVWYQNGNGWYSYFGDTELKLTPELLLNDEDLILVDEKKVQNYARLKEKDGRISYQWITPPLEIDKRFGEPSYRHFYPFQPMRPNFCDAKTLQPVTLKKGDFKQFFLTVHATKDQAPGLYSGDVRLLKNGKQIAIVPIVVKILPFVLPEPASYYDVEKPFRVSSYSYISFDLITCENGGDLELAKRQLEAVLANQVRHNQTMHMVRGQAPYYEHDFTIDVMKKVGMHTDRYLMGGNPNTGTNRLDMQHNAKMQRNYYLNKVGHTNIYFGYGDEPPAKWVMSSRPVFEIYQNAGLKFFIAGKDQVFYSGGYVYDFFNTAMNPEDREASRKWNEVGHAWVAWYATHHVGPENPAYNRRQYGIAPYLAGYSAMCNYAHHFGPYNDRTLTYKPMVFAYGCGDGVIDTIQWEGFREGIDDIRYVTLLKKLALEAVKSGNLKVQYAGRIALQFLAELDAASCDLNQTRLESIRMIIQLRDLLKK